MLENVDKFLDKLDPLGTPKRPNLAAAVGFLTGGIGLALYFRSFVDLLVPIGVALVVLTVNSALGGAGPIGGAVLAGIYGYCRVVNSNRRLAADPLPTQAGLPV